MMYYIRTKYNGATKMKPKKLGKELGGYMGAKINGVR
jgi:hypothetical protein